MRNDISLNKLEHSENAISISHSFYNKKVMIYVEGDDDISFWDELFRGLVPPNFYEIEQVHGKENLPKYLNGIKDGSIKNTIVACDSDYSSYTGTSMKTSPFIILTYGHSIENVMFCPFHVSNYLKRLLHTTDNYDDEVNIWFKNFCEIALKLLPYDILSTKKGLGLKFYGLRCFFFFRNDKIPLLDSNKIDEYIDKNKGMYNIEELKDINDKISKDERENRYIMQGHFLADAVMQYIRVFLKHKNSSITSLCNDAIYGEFYACRKYCKSICPAKKYITNKIIDVADAYTKQLKGGILK